VTLATAPTEANFALCADDNFTIRINGRNGASSGRRNSTLTEWIDVKSLLQAGENTIEITVSNMPPDDGRLVSVRTDVLPDSDSPAGLLLYARVRNGTDVMDFISDRDWTVAVPPRPDTITRTTPPVAEAAEPGVTRELGQAVELGGVELAPWKVGRYFFDLAAAPKDTLPIERASLVVADPLMTALGRPNREQVITVRQPIATTLQALELTNGATLARLLQQGAEHLTAKPIPSAELIESVYLQTVGRAPTAAEQRIALQLVGSPAKCAGVEDLLWAVTMQPEFQLIH
jgi:hypothetical protein